MLHRSRVLTELRQIHLRLEGRSAGGFCRVDHQQRRPGGNLGVLADVDRPHRAGELGIEGRLHLHRFDHGKAVAGLHLISGFDGDGNDNGRRRRPDDATFVVGDPVGDAVDLDEMGRAVDNGQDPVRPPGAVQTGSGAAERLDRGFDHVGTAGQTKGLRGELGNVDGESLPAVPQLDVLADSRLNLGSAVTRRVPEQGNRGTELLPVCGDRGSDDRCTGMPAAEVLASVDEAIDPTNIEIAVDEVGMRQE